MTAVFTGVQGALDATTLLHALTGATRTDGSSPTAEEVEAAIRRTADGIHRKLKAGPRADALVDRYRRGAAAEQLTVPSLDQARTAKRIRDRQMT